MPIVHRVCFATGPFYNMTPEERMDADNRSIYVGNVRYLFIVFFFFLLLIHGFCINAKNSFKTLNTLNRKALVYDPKLTTPPDYHFP